MQAGYVNTVPPPPDAPAYTVGRRSFPVIARLVLPDGDEHWLPARALRWTATHVLTSVEPDGEPSYVWLTASDVRRMILMPGTPGTVAELVTQDVDEPAMQRAS